MVLANEDEVRRAVLASLDDVTGGRQGNLIDDDSKLRDLMTGDDFTFVFLPNVEKALGVKTQASAWGTVSTVGQAIDVLVKARTQ